MAARDDIGSRGEYLFSASIMNFCGRRVPYFRPRFLGEKARTLDFLVELVDAGDQLPFFFAQVKTTQKAPTKKDKRLQVGMLSADVQRFSRVPAPTYMIGIDELREEGYIAPILEGMRDTISSIATTYPLDPLNLARLYDEVRLFWSIRDMKWHTSIFSV